MANNMLTKIPPKFPSNFKQLTGTCANVYQRNNRLSLWGVKFSTGLSITELNLIWFASDAKVFNVETLGHNDYVCKRIF